MYGDRHYLNNSTRRFANEKDSHVTDEKRSCRASFSINRYKIEKDPEKYEENLRWRGNRPLFVSHLYNRVGVKENFYGSCEEGKERLLKELALSKKDQDVLYRIEDICICGTQYTPYKWDGCIRYQDNEKLKIAEVIEAIDSSQ